MHDHDGKLIGVETQSIEKTELSEPDSIVRMLIGHRVWRADHSDWKSFVSFHEDDLEDFRRLVAELLRALTLQEARALHNGRLNREGTKEVREATGDLLAQLKRRSS